MEKVDEKIEKNEEVTASTEEQNVEKQEAVETKPEEKQETQEAPVEEKKEAAEEPEKEKKEAAEKPVETKETNKEITEDKTEETKKITENKTEETREVAEEKAEMETEEKTETAEEESEDIEFEHMLEESLANIQELEVGDKVTGEIINITDSFIFVTLGGKRDAYAEKADYTDKKGKLKYEVGDKLSGYIVKYSETETLIAKSLLTVNLRVLEEAYEGKIPIRGKVTSLTKGGYNIDVSGIRVFCPLSHIDAKMVVDPQQFIGETFDFQIIDFKDNGRNIVVSRKVILEEELNKKKKETLAKLEVGSVVQGKVTRLTSFGAFVDLGGIDGLLHISQFSWSHIESPSDVLNIGDTIEAKIIKMQKEKISLSMKALQENPINKVYDELQEGQVVNCKVLRNLPFGSFVEIKSGVEGLIPISEMARGRRIATPDEVVKEGDLVEAQILKVNREKKKISLSMKRLQPDPWDTLQQQFSENDIVNGVIENIASFGVFIRITEGITGLLPNVKLKVAGEKISKDNIGQEYKVRIVKIDPVQKRVSLEPSSMPESVTETKDDWNKYKKHKPKKNEVIEDNPFSHL
ncbi:MAG: S1 RNA-binding domain-containing protein [Candidatus Cloacimonetes bacterium]|nr:S1 RNA-binding domain-containing protein [Candidatus Cloacimonadota bacterium]MCF7814543.1 S1 RNA-binding domain-containing protein [Candidatus Cloacimonadota bacterium]MCF7868829.1 S1 RNA-binding domain-containing protein [Candidatus Cloacimonadota bacterium]MCF7884231.1 S1 RNA-binding domain-containing protein [Candidatus Cloacimonadota bacterium]